MEVGSTTSGAGLAGVVTMVGPLEVTGFVAAVVGLAVPDGCAG